MGSGSAGIDVGCVRRHREQARSHIGLGLDASAMFSTSTRRAASGVEHCRVELDTRLQATLPSGTAMVPAWGTRLGRKVSGIASNRPNANAAIAARVRNAAL